MNPTFTSQPGGDIRGYVKYITDLTKLYLKEQKYGGGEYDILNVKLDIFYNYCKKLRIPEYEKPNVFIAMLKDKAFEFYYDKIVGREYNFPTIVRMLRDQFETEERAQKYLTE